MREKSVNNNSTTESDFMNLGLVKAMKEYKKLHLGKI